MRQMTLNDCLWASIYQSLKEGSQKKNEFKTPQEREAYEMKRGGEIYEELKAKYGLR